MTFAMPFIRIRFLVAFVLAIALGCAPPFSSGPHNPAVIAAAATDRHAALGDAVSANHEADHSQDEGAPEEQKRGHTHGHNSTDHTHDAGHAVATGPKIEPTLAGRRTHWSNYAHNNGLRERLDRPPRALM